MMINTCLTFRLNAASARKGIIREVTTVRNKRPGVNAGPKAANAGFVASAVATEILLRVGNAGYVIF